MISLHNGITLWDCKQIKGLSRRNMERKWKKNKKEKWKGRKIKLKKMKRGCERNGWKRGEEVEMIIKRDKRSCKSSEKHLMLRQGDRMQEGGSSFNFCSQWNKWRVVNLGAFVDFTRCSLVCLVCMLFVLTSIFCGLCLLLFFKCFLLIYCSLV